MKILKEQEITYNELEPTLAKLVLEELKSLIADKQNILVLTPDNITFYVAAQSELDQEFIGIADVTIFEDNIAYFDFMVHPNCQRQGIGRKLLRKVMDICKEKEVHELRATARLFSPSAWILISTGFEVIESPPHLEYIDTSAQSDIAYLSYKFT